MFTLNCKGKLLVLEKPVVMGILNITPDSFYTGSRFADGSVLLKTAELMLREGAAILDIGGQSTRPGSAEISVEEELQRVIPVIGSLHEHFPEAILSIDTWRAAVAQQSVAAGASIVNDIGSGDWDAEMIPLVASLQVPYICMHSKGRPNNMQSLAVYDDVTREVLDYCIAKKYRCAQAGINDIIIDPGFGFAKTIAHNFELLKNLQAFAIIGCPVLVGISRKSTIYKTLGISPGEALNGTTVLNAAAILKGASILRVHDVKEALEAVTLLSAMNT